MTELVCSFCRSEQRVAIIEGGDPAAHRLAILAVRCRRCFRVGSMQASRQLELALPPPERGSVHGPPDDVGDEELARRRSRTRRTAPP